MNAHAAARVPLGKPGFSAVLRAAWNPGGGLGSRWVPWHGRVVSGSTSPGVSLMAELPQPFSQVHSPQPGQGMVAKPGTAKAPETSTSIMASR